MSNQDFSVRLRIIFAADDDGTCYGNTAPTREALAPMMQALVDGMQKHWAGTGLSFVYLAERDFEVRKDTKLRRNFDLGAATIASFPRSGATTSQQDIDVLLTAADTKLHRNAVAAERPNALLWIVGGPNTIDFDTVKQIWNYEPQSYGNFSGGDLGFVLLSDLIFSQSVTVSANNTSRAAHETGHYLHLNHTHREPLQNEDDPSITTLSGVSKPADDAGRLDRWEKAIAAWIDSQVAAGTSVEDALKIYDSDRPGVTDTPADPGAGILGLANLAAGGTEDSEGPVFEVTVQPNNTAGPVVFQPDRGNLMGYYLDDDATGETKHFSPGQIAVMQDSLVKGNRHPLVAAQLGDTSWPNIRLCAVWSPQTAGQFLAAPATEPQHKANNALWQGKGFHLGGQCAYVDNGTVMYDAFWDEGVMPQFILWGWAGSDVVSEVPKQESKGQRVRQIQAYLQPGAGLRYNVVFEPGNYTQHVLLNLTAGEAHDAWLKYMPSGFRLHQLDAALDENGVIRYAVVFVPATTVQHYVSHDDLPTVDAAYAAQWNAGKKLSSLKVVSTSNGPVYAGIWDPDGGGQLVYWLHVRERILEVYDEMWWQGYRLRSLSTVAM